MVKSNDVKSLWSAGTRLDRPRTRLFAQRTVASWPINTIRLFPTTVFSKLQDGDPVDLVWMGFSSSSYCLIWRLAPSVSRRMLASICFAYLLSFYRHYFFGSSRKRTMPPLRSFGERGISGYNDFTPLETPY